MGVLGIRLWRALSSTKPMRRRGRCGALSVGNKGSSMVASEFGGSVTGR